MFDIRYRRKRHSKIPECLAPFSVTCVSVMLPFPAEFILLILEANPGFMAWWIKALAAQPALPAFDRQNPW